MENSVQVAAQVPNGHTLIVRAPALIEGANPVQIALLRASAVTDFGASFQVGTAPGGIAFDGENMWISNYADGTLSVLNAATGKVVGTYVPMFCRTIGTLTFDGYPWDSFFPNSRTFLCRSERFFITAIFLV